MRARINKIYKGKIAASIERSFSDVPELHLFLSVNGVNIEFRDAVDDLAAEFVVYNVPLVSVEASNEYQ